MESLHADSDVKTPIIFVLSSGADPKSNLYAYVE